MYVVIDTVSLVNLCFVELSNLRVIEWLLDEFKVRTTNKVYVDGLHYIQQSNDEEAHDIYTTIISNLRYSEESCTSYVESILAEGDRLENIDEGEETVLSLTMRIAMSSSSYVILVTDDYRALGPLREVLKDHGIGVAVTGFHIIRQLGMMNSNHISVDDIKVASQSLLSEVRDNDKAAHIEQKPDQLFLESAERISHLRGKGAARSECRN